MIKYLMKEINLFLYKIIQNMKITQSNPFKNNFKVLNNHKDYILFLSQLKDGRLASSSFDHCLNIYKK